MAVLSGWVAACRATAAASVSSWVTVTPFSCCVTASPSRACVTAPPPRAAPRSAAVQLPQELVVGGQRVQQVLLLLPHLGEHRLRALDRLGLVGQCGQRLVRQQTQPREDAVVVAVGPE